MSTLDIINAIESGDKSAARAAFESELKMKISDALDAKRVEVAQAVYNKANGSSEE